MDKKEPIQTTMFDVSTMLKAPSSRRRHEDYGAFVKKFELKKTTDDCYTPAAVYDAVLEWVAEVVDISGREIVRPFWPGGDFENFDYPEGCIVIDNPPFSIISKIARFYMAHGIRFFLFAPHLTLFSAINIEWTCIVCDCTIEYENKAKINTGFISNLFGACRIMTAPVLCRKIKEAQAKIKEERAKYRNIPKYDYPANVVSSALLGKIASHVEFRVMADECVQIKKLDAQQDKAIYGGAFLLNEAKAAEVKAAEVKRSQKAIVWELSDREKKLIKSLG